ncbi:arginase family protein [Brevibacillus invocatus]|uniref:arginase family protein n=1 Tax=Brevibacillus invocatus TaxID=173959 RepID=UPI0020411596|nr:arginase family protein [Brevibacillus invocatus]MCM3082100.1 arginase family protein [Brevibacillus invocatus]MCM3432518.1 arginase family protein [Brevibacillus invocatus]
MIFSTQILQQLKEAARVISEAKPGAIFTIGGDCGIEVAPVSYLNQIYDGDLAVVWLDAHGDLDTPSTSPSKLFHGMPLRALLGQGDEEILKQCFSTLSVDQVILAGVRDLDEPEESYIQQSSMRVWTVKQLEEGSSELIEWINMRGFSHVYIHVDLDVLDPGHFPFYHVPDAKWIGCPCINEYSRGAAEEFSGCWVQCDRICPQGSG